MTSAIGILAFLVAAAAAIAPTGASGAVCPAGSSAAILGGRHVCLHAGLACKTQFQSAYRRHGLVCTASRLRTSAKSKPLVTKLALPAAEPLPTGATTLTLPTSDWGAQDVGGLAVTDSAVWTSSGLWRIDAATNALSGPLATGAQSGDITTGDGSVWASDYSYGLVRRYDAVTGRLVATIQLPAGSAPEGLVDGFGAIWVANHHGGTITRIDPATNTVVATIKVGTVGAGGPQGIAAGLGSVWVGIPTDSAVVRVDPQTNTVQADIRIPGQAVFEPCGGIAVGQSAVWISMCLDGTLVARIDPSRNVVTAIDDVGGNANQLAADGDTVWFVAGSGDAASVIHLGADNSVQARYALPAGFLSGGTALGFGSIWLSDHNNPRVIRIPIPG
jgi:virginiamycin B lyase